MALNLDGEYKVFRDNSQEVTLHIRGASDTFVPYAGITIIKGETRSSLEVTDAGGTITVRRCTWWLTNEVLTDEVGPLAKLKAGDAVEEDDGTLWFIPKNGRVTKDPFGAMWEFDTVQGM